MVLRAIDVDDDDDFGTTHSGTVRALHQRSLKKPGVQAVPSLPSSKQPDTTKPTTGEVPTTKSLP